MEMLMKGEADAASDQQQRLLILAN
jgi:hypothetical protein